MAKILISTEPQESGVTVSIWYDNAITGFPVFTSLDTDPSTYYLDGRYYDPFLNIYRSEPYGLVSSGNQLPTLTVTVTYLTPTTARLTALATGGSGSNYQYNLNAGLYQASGIFTVSQEGSYTIRATDPTNGIISTTKTVDVAFTASIATPIATTGKKPVVLTTAVAYAAQSATLTVKATGGNNNGYKYNLNGGADQANGTFAITKTGDYTIKVTDATDASISTTKVININLETQKTTEQKEIQEGADQTDASLTATGGSFLAQLSSFFRTIPTWAWVILAVVIVGGGVLLLTTGKSSKTIQPQAPSSKPQTSRAASTGKTKRSRKVRGL